MVVHRRGRHHAALPPRPRPDTISGWAACSGVASYDLTGEPDATYTFSVQATDGALNAGPITTRNYTLDTTPPGLPMITSSPGQPARHLPAWSFAGEPGTTLQCRLDRGATPISGWSSCSGSRNYDLTGEPDGVYTFSVRAIDAVGNVGAARTNDYELVTTPPPQPMFLSEPAAVGSARARRGRSPGARGRRSSAAWSAGRTRSTPGARASARAPTT